MEEPFKGYWMLPSNLLMTSETIEECAVATIYEFIGIKNLYMKQSDIFSKIDRLPGMRILANSLICLIDYDNYSYNKNSKIESSWFDIDEVPKMIYDHGHYYPILDCVCEDKEQEVSTSQLYFGVNMLIDETYAAYLDFEENKYKNILSKVNKPEFIEKIEYIKEIRTQRIS